MSEAEFFGSTVERQIAPWELDAEENAAGRLVDELLALPKPLQKTMIAKFQLMLETASDVHHIKDKRPAYRENRESSPEWQMLNARN
jgi:hypothetical protein